VIAAAAACGPTPEVRAALENKYSERPVGLGAMRGEGTLTLFVNPSTGTWTLLAEAEHDMSCIVAAGQSWRFAKVAVGNGI
jgi:hypothetical protein